MTPRHWTALHRSRSSITALLLAWLLCLTLVTTSPAAARLAPTDRTDAAASTTAGTTTTGPTQRPAVRKKRPAVTRVRPASGTVTGGTAITITGRNFAHVRRVTVGGQPVRVLKVKGPTKITARTPAGFRGNAAVQVLTKAGVSPAARPARFRYVDPRAVSSTTASTKDSTLTGSGVVWVTGGNDVDAPAPGPAQPWVVGIGPAGTVPAVGDGYYLAPGSTAFPAGLAGVVSKVTSQADDVTAVEVRPSDLDEVFAELRVRHSDGPPAARAAGRDISDASVSFPKLGASSFLCTDQNGQSASFSGSLGLSIENVHKVFEFDAPTLFFKGYFSSWVRYEPVLTGKITATAKISCKIKPEWQNANRRIIPIGTTGATLSIGPTASFSVSAAGTVQVTQRSRRMVGITYNQGNTSFIDAKANLGTNVTAADLAVKVSADAGVSVQIGYLDRIGVELKVLLTASGTIKAKNPPRQACVDLVFGVSLKVNAFLDAWIARWESPGYSKTWPFAEFHKCTPPLTPVPASSGPVITSLRLPAAASGTPYDARLSTADERAGTWSLVAGALPSGLSLDPGSGTISGVPTGPVGDRVLQVRFTDAGGRSDTQTVRLFLNPAPPVNGGDIQATLTWGSAADLDLHVIDPDGAHIYYGDRSSPSGGTLDRDANAGCGEALTNPIENVYWPTGGAPSGTYEVYVANWSPCDQGDLSWRLVVRVNGAVVLDTSGHDTSSVYTFSVGAGGRPSAVTRGERPDRRDTAGKG